MSHPQTLQIPFPEFMLSIPTIQDSSQKLQLEYEKSQFSCNSHKKIVPLQPKLIRNRHNYCMNIVDTLLNQLITIEDNKCISYYQMDKYENLSLCLSKAHEHFVLDIIYTYLTTLYSADQVKQIFNIFISNGYEPSIVEDIKCFDFIPHYCEQLHLVYLRSSANIKSNNMFSRVLSKDNMLATGAVYTQNNIVNEIVSRTLNNSTINSDTRALDFACGTGRFYESLLEKFTESGISTEHAILHAIDAIDIDPIAINILRLKALYALTKSDRKDYFTKLSLLPQRIRLENALMPDFDIYDSINLATNYHHSTYDFIVSNPPYLVLKPNKKTSAHLAEDMKNQIKYFNSCGLYRLANQGMLNLYQLSIERMLSMLKIDGRLGIICPSTLFADKSASKLRKHIILKNNLEHITYFPEKALLFENNVTQATNIFHLTKGGTTNNISISADGKDFSVSVTLIKQLFPENMEIPLISETDWKYLEDLSHFKKLKDYPQIRNRRGELDLTLYHSYITNEKTGIRLIRGKMITPNGIVTPNDEYVLPTFLDKKTEEFRKMDYGKVRLIGQNIANVDSAQRLRFVFSEQYDVLGNSCNYLSAELTLLKKLKILLSSKLLNWRFSITSSNNHINNYELDELPMPNFEEIDENLIFENQESLDKYVCSLYRIDYNSFKATLQ